MEGRTVAAFVRAWPSRHRVTADGLNDVQHRDSGTRLAVATLDFTSTETVVSLGPSLAKRDFQQEHAWRPTEAQLQQVANVLNRASARPPVVAVTAEGLVPV